MTSPAATLHAAPDRELLQGIYDYQRKNLRYNRIWLVLYAIFIILPISLAVAGAVLLSQRVGEFRAKVNLPGLDSIVQSVEDFQKWQQTLSTQTAALGSGTTFGGGNNSALQTELKTINNRLKNIEQQLAK